MSHTMSTLILTTVVVTMKDHSIKPKFATILMPVVPEKMKSDDNLVYKAADYIEELKVSNGEDFYKDKLGEEFFKYYTAVVSGVISERAKIKQEDIETIGIIDIVEKNAIEPSLMNFIDVPDDVPSKEKISE